jgi:hypothetical protein
MTEDPITRNELRSALDRLADELRRSGPEAVPVHLRMLVRRAEAFLDAGEEGRPEIRGLLKRLGTALESRDRWQELGGSPGVLAERLKAYAHVLERAA